jgi:hypothetical protein
MKRTNIKKNKTMKNKSMKNKSMKNKSMKNKTMKNRSMKNKSMKNKSMKNKSMKYEDVDYATDIDMLTILSKKDQTVALNKVNEFLKSSKNQSHVKEMTKRKEQIEELIKGE